jgi:hypothetical protein
MPSETYNLFLSAMRKRQQVVCTYQGQPRELCPILLGRTGLEEKSLVFQFAGRTNRGPVAPPWHWQCLKLSEVLDARLQVGPWHDGGGHATMQFCMKMVEYDVNPDSPYSPAFRL